jgi:DnaJ-class molecular chaperone
VTLFLLIAAALACWAVSLYLWPLRPCGKCKGSGRNAGSNPQRFGECKRCGGSGRRQRFGSRTVHRQMLAVRREHGRKRQRASGDPRR